MKKKSIFAFFTAVILLILIFDTSGAVRIAERSSAALANRSHTIVTRIDLKGDEEGVIVALGGMKGGFSMFIKGGRLFYDYNYLDGVHYTLMSEYLPEGLTELKFKFTRTIFSGGIGEIYVNGEKVDTVGMPKMHTNSDSLAETIDVGRDTGTQVTELYRGPFSFTGELDRVRITLID